MATPSTVRTFGSVVSAEFIGALVQGLPDLPGGVSALVQFADVLRKGADAIPPGYGDAIGAKVYSLIRRTFRQKDLVEEAMLVFTTTAVRRRVYLAAGWPLPTAERYVLRSVANAAKNILRGQGRRRRARFRLSLSQSLVNLRDRTRTHGLCTKKIVLRRLLTCAPMLNSTLEGGRSREAHEDPDYEVLTVDEAVARLRVTRPEVMAASEGASRDAPSADRACCNASQRRDWASTAAALQQCIECGWPDQHHAKLAA